jgi:AraC-like DNA-binding protein
MININDIAQQYLRSSRLRQDPIDDFEIALLEVIAEHISRTDLSVQLLAQKMHINERTFNKCCNTLFGANPSALIKSIRLHIVRKLADETKNLDDAISAAGFKNSAEYKRAHTALNGTA